MVQGLAMILALACGLAAAGENIKSGPQVGQTLPGPFHPMNINGENAGEKCCLYCKNGSNPVAMIFARECSVGLTSLMKKIDECTTKNADRKMGSFVVFLSDSEELAKQLKGIAEKEGIKQTILAIDNPSGPQGYKVAKDADVTVVLYTDHVVKANHTFAKGELTEDAIAQVVNDVSTIVPKE
jgi:hypothetical protein